MAGVNPDLAKERRTATFDTEDLTNVIYRGPENVRRRRYLHNSGIQDPNLNNAKPWAFQNREEQYDTAMWKHLYIMKRLREMGIKDKLEQFWFTDAAAPCEMNPMGLQYGMFIPTIEKQGTKEQKERWLPRAHRMEIIGTYAQTEMGHGTFIRGLETTATYDPKTQEFIVNSPTITSMKYWPGGLGKTSNYCLVMAQLQIEGKRHGIHMFMVQLRDLKTHALLPGIECGDIGPKFGFSAIDNGYLKLSNVRIPRTNMLMRNAQVLEDGTFIQPKHQQIGYGTMVLVRAAIVTQASRGLSKACVIAVRYSAVRRQTEVSPGGEEAQVIDYQTQQYKLFPLIATAYAMYFVGRYIQDYHSQSEAEFEAGNYESLPQLHATCAGMKAFSTWACTAGIETCRLCCGGHGYSHASGIPKLYVFNVPGCTYEGENNVMMLQLARYLMKAHGSMKQGGPLASFVQYLKKDLNKKSCMTESVDLQCLLMAYEHRATRLVNSAATKIRKHVMSGKSQQEAWNMTTVPLTWAATAHCHAFAVKIFAQIVMQSNMEENTRNVMTSLCKLYAIHGIVEHLGDFIQDGFFNSSQVEILQAKLTDLLAEIRRNAVALVDAFDYPDKILGSCLGRYDGQVYQALYDYAKSSPLNEKEVLDSYHKYIKPAQAGQTSATSQKSML